MVPTEPICVYLSVFSSLRYSFESLRHKIKRASTRIDINEEEKDEEKKKTMLSVL